MRYALYFTPAAQTPLRAFGCSVLGYDAEAGLDVPFANHADLADGELAAITREPRRYGFHATLKAPFYLRDDTSEGSLLAGAERFAASQQAVWLPRLEVATLGRFLALVPAGSDARLDRLASACVRQFDRFRAPMTPLDRARRLRAPLSPREIALMDQWGYPYVLEAFRFHMTLTGPVALQDQGRVQRALATLFEAVPQPVAIDALTVARQDTRDARFTVLCRLPLGGDARARLSPSSGA